MHCLVCFLVVFFTQSSLLLVIVRSDSGGAVTTGMPRPQFSAAQTVQPLLWPKHGGRLARTVEISDPMSGVSASANAPPGAKTPPAANAPLPNGSTNDSRVSALPAPLHSAAILRLTALLCSRLQHLRRASEAGLTIRLTA